MKQKILTEIDIAKEIEEKRGKHEPTKTVWYWYSEIPTNFFAEYFLPSFEYSKVCELDLIKIAKSIEEGRVKKATQGIVVALFEMYQQGYVFLEFWNPFGGFKNSNGEDSFLIACKEYDKDYYFNKKGFLRLYYLDSFKRLGVSLTKKGEEWYNSIKKDYAFLLEDKEPLREETKNKNYIFVPDGYIKKGVLRQVVNDDVTEVEWTFEEIE